jgi:hypothetical protein
MVDDRDFENLCALLAELAEHVRRVSIGTQGLAVDSQVTDLIRRAEQLRDKQRPS